MSRSRADTAIVLLAGAPLATHPSTKPAPGGAIDFSSTAVRAHRAELAARRSDFRRWLEANAPGVEVVAEYDIVLNGVALLLNGEALETILSAPMVTNAQYARVHRPTDV